MGGLIAVCLFISVELHVSVVHGIQGEVMLSL